LVDYSVINYFSFLIKLELVESMRYFMYAELTVEVNFVEFILMVQIIEQVFKY